MLEMAEEGILHNNSTNSHVEREGEDHMPNSAEEESSKRTCWVCFATDEDDATAEWVQPCNCRGTTKWVHQSCIQRWVDEKQKGNPSGNVACPQCNTQYIIVFPHMGPIVVVLDTVDNIVYKVCPFMAAGIVVGSIYWTAVTYGAVTVMQVVGHKEGMMAMEQADPLVLLVGLPTIPIMLILGKMIHWEDTVLGFLRRHSYKGGAAFIAIKGSLKIYHKQKQFVRQHQRKILDYTASNRIATSRNAVNTQSPTHESR
ncbi:E3 ubiquitin-protein ligase MARCH5 [Gryllus bimaculatus]|nr:E3 ubiquitin-protein ligase MARCH5 [Gryllus bimaculatus]